MQESGNSTIEFEASNARVCLQPGDVGVQKPRCKDAPVRRRVAVSCELAGDQHHRGAHEDRLTCMVNIYAANVGEGMSGFMDGRPPIGEGCEEQLESR